MPHSPHEEIIEFFARSTRNKGHTSDDCNQHLYIFPPMHSNATLNPCMKIVTRRDNQDFLESPDSHTYKFRGTPKEPITLTECVLWNRCWFWHQLSSNCAAQKQGSDLFALEHWDKSHAPLLSSSRSILMLLSYLHMPLNAVHCVHHKQRRPGQCLAPQTALWTTDHLHWHWTAKKRWNAPGHTKQSTDRKYRIKQVAGHAHN